ncbi:MAG TPA: hypothetical protein VMW26_06940 [Methanomassiliicoccales archaeon]|nr:hypothetical protein [Methanomassiliicoccales archaeon]
MDGIDGSGKSTIAHMIKYHYEEEGDEVYLVAHPSESLLGRISRKALQGRGRALKLVATIFYILDVLNSVRMQKNIEKRYQTAIFVRYLMGTAYLPENLAPRGYQFFQKLLPVPKRLLLVDIDPQVALRRIAERDDHLEMFENLENLVKIRRKVLLLAGDDWEVVDNSGPEIETKRKVIEIINRWDLHSKNR